MEAQRLGDSREVWRWEILEGKGRGQAKQSKASTKLALGMIRCLDSIRRGGLAISLTAPAVYCHKKHYGGDETSRGESRRGGLKPEGRGSPSKACECEGTFENRQDTDRWHSTALAQPEKRKKKGHGDFRAVPGKETKPSLGPIYLVPARVARLSCLVLSCLGLGVSCLGPRDSRPTQAASSIRFPTCQRQRGSETDPGVWCLVPRRNGQAFLGAPGHRFHGTGQDCEDARQDQKGLNALPCP
jgi:hypothetical protein